MPGNLHKGERLKGENRSSSIELIQEVTYDSVGSGLVPQKPPAAKSMCLQHGK